MSDPPSRRRATWDIVTTTVVLGAAWIIFAIGLLGDAVSTFMYADYCPVGICHAQTAGEIQVVVAIVALAVAVAGCMIAVVLLARRRRGWPAAVATAVAEVLTWVVGGVLFTAALGRS